MNGESRSTLYRELSEYLTWQMKRTTSAHPIGHVIGNLVTKEEACILRLIDSMSLAAEDVTESDVVAYLVAVPRVSWQRLAKESGSIPTLSPCSRK